MREKLTPAPGLVSIRTHFPLPPAARQHVQPNSLNVHAHSSHVGKGIQDQNTRVGDIERQCRTVLGVVQRRLAIDAIGEPDLARFAVRVAGQESSRQPVFDLVPCSVVAETVAVCLSVLVPGQYLQSRGVASGREPASTRQRWTSRFRTATGPGVAAPKRRPSHQGRIVGSRT